MVDIISDDEFDSEVVNSDIPVIVDFYAEWCGPCKALLPILEDLADTYEDEVKIVKVNSDGSDLTSEYGVRGIPTLLFFKDGQVVDTHVGMAMKASLEEKIQNLL